MQVSGYGRQCRVEVAAVFEPKIPDGCAMHRDPCCQDSTSHRRLLLAQGEQESSGLKRANNPREWVAVG